VANGWPAVDVRQAAARFGRQPGGSRATFCGGRHSEIAIMSWVEETYFCNDEAPAFLEQELNRLYGTRYSCLPRFKLYGSWSEVRAYVARRAGVAVAVFLFRCEKGRAIVLNEGMHVSEQHANRFASYLFRNHDGLSQVQFHFVEARARRFAYPFQRATCGEDSVVELPASVEAYTASLGPSTRALLHQRVRQVRRELPGFRFEVYETQDVPVPHIRAIIRLNRLHTQMKGVEAPIDEAEEERIIAYVALCGFVTVATTNGRVCAGAITYRLGSNFTARILAHDPTYGSHRLGITCAYLTICECINAGDSRFFHFGWGQGAYSQALGGRARQLVHLSLFRSRLHVLAHAGAALGALLGGMVFAVRRQLVRTVRRNGVLRALRRNRSQPPGDSA
jgi:hypothetical protein